MEGSSLLDHHRNVDVNSTKDTMKKITRFRTNLLKASTLTMCHTHLLLFDLLLHSGLRGLAGANFTNYIKLRKKKSNLQIYMIGAVKQNETTLITDSVCNTYLDNAINVDLLQ